jgi:hypothetical protein
VPDAEFVVEVNTLLDDPESVVAGDAESVVAGDAESVVAGDAESVEVGDAESVAMGDAEGIVIEAIVGHWHGGVEDTEADAENDPPNAEDDADAVSGAGVDASGSAVEVGVEVDASGSAVEVGVEVGAAVG